MIRDPVPQSKRATSTPAARFRNNPHLLRSYRSTIGEIHQDPRPSNEPNDPHEQDKSTHMCEGEPWR